MSATKKLIVEVALNETVHRSENRHVPITPEEIAADAYACWREGATIIHFHNRVADFAEDGTYDTSLAGSAEHYAETMRLIAERCDVISYPTYSYPNTPGREEAEHSVHPHVKALRELPDIRMEMFVLHVGATNIGRYDFKAEKFLYDHVSTHSHEQMTRFLGWCLSSGLQPGFIVREPGQMRHLLMYRQMGLLREPINVHLNLSDFAPYGPMPDFTGIQCLLNIFPPSVRHEWFIHNFTTFLNDPDSSDSHRQLNVLAVAMGGHVRVGIGDKPTWDGKELSNAQMVRRIRQVAEVAGREVASTQETRLMLGLSKVHCVPPAMDRA